MIWAQRLAGGIGQVDGQEPPEVAIGEIVIAAEQAGGHLELERQPTCDVVGLAIDEAVDQVVVIGAIAQASADREAAVGARTG